jgi:hypothetical protein
VVEVDKLALQETVARRIEHSSLDGDEEDKRDT